MDKTAPFTVLQWGNRLAVRILVPSPKEFNRKTKIVIGLPMTTSASNKTNPFLVKFFGENGKVRYVLAHQPNSFDWR